MVRKSMFPNVPNGSSCIGDNRSTRTLWQVSVRECTDIKEEKGSFEKQISISASTIPNAIFCNDSILPTKI